MAKGINTVLSLKDDFSGSLQKITKTAQTSVGHIKKAFDSGETGADKLSAGLQQTGREVSKLGKSFMPVSGAVGGALGVAAKTASDFESQMNRVKAISGATNGEFGKLRDTAIDLGAKSVFSASETAQGMENLASAGFNTNEIISATPGLLDLAASSGSDLATASDIAASAIRGFGLDAKDAGHVADVLATNASKTNAQVEDTGEALKYIAPVANAAGLSIEEVTAAIGIMANAGVKGSQAGTTLRGSLTRIMKPTKQVTEALSSLGVETYDSEGKMKPLTTIIGDLKKSMKGLTDEQKQQKLATIFGTESLSGMMALVNAGPDELDKLTKAYEDCDGSASKMADTMNSGTAGAVEQMKGALESMAINLGSALSPAIITAADAIGSLAQKISELPSGVQKFIATAGLIVAALGPVLIFTGSLISSVGSIIPVIAKVGSAVSGLYGLIITNPVAAVIVVIIAAVAAAAFIIITHMDQIKAGLSKLKSFFTGAMNGMKSVGSSAMGVIKSKINGVKQTANELKTAAGNLKRAWAETMADIANKIKGAFTTISKYAKKIKNAITGIPSKISGFFGKITGNATGTAYWSGGLTGINEHGGEIINLPSGTKIIPHDIAKKQASGPSVSVTVQVMGNMVGNSEYADYLGGIISRKVLAAMANR